MTDYGTKIQDRVGVFMFLLVFYTVRVLYCTVGVSAPKLSTIKYLECENHVSEEFFLVVSTVSRGVELEVLYSTTRSNTCRRAGPAPDAAELGQARSGRRRAFGPGRDPRRAVRPGKLARVVAAARRVRVDAALAAGRDAGASCVFFF